MTTPYPTEGDAARDTGDAAPEEVEGAPLDETEPSQSTAPAPEQEPVPEPEPEPGESTTEHVAVDTTQSRAPAAAETTELDSLAITRRLEPDVQRTVGAGDLGPRAERLSTGAPTAASLSGTGETVVPPGAAVPAEAAPRRRGARMGTVVWGILLAAIGAGIVARGLGVEFDVELALIVVLCVMGGALLVGSIVAGVRRT